MRRIWCLFFGHKWVPWYYRDDPLIDDPPYGLQCAYCGIYKQLEETGNWL